MIGQRALLLVGSPHGLDHSTSGRLGGRLLDALRERRFETEKIHVHAAMRSPEELQVGLASVTRADVVVLSLPLYVDSFPAPVIALLERLADRPAEHARTRFFVIIQCGFPEREQNDTALRIAEHFASEVGWEWLGGLAFGGAETHGGLPAEAIDSVAQAIADGKSIPNIVLGRSMPAWIYRIGGNVMWRHEARKIGTARKLRARPYAD